MQRHINPEAIKAVIQHAITYDLEDGLTIRLLSLPYFLATKFAAYHSRGGDPRTSHDFEDIIYLMDNCSNLVASIRDADQTIRAFLKSEFEKIWTNPYRDEIVGCHHQPWNVDARFKIVSEKMAAIVSP